MTSRIRVLLLAVGATVMGAATLYAQAQKKPAIAFPTGYRKWTHVKSMVIWSKDHPLFNTFEGLHNVYVNDVGLTPLQQGKAYPDGTIFVFDLLGVRSARGAMETTQRKFIGVMKKNSKRYADTGGWGWEVFKADEQKGSLADMKPCFSCHASQKRADYVYSTYTP